MCVRQFFRHYEIQAEIGRGGMSRVFRAHDPSLDRQVALKVLLERYNQDDERVQQFEKEAHITASFTHPNVVKVYAVGRELSDLVIVMELVENGSLDELIAEQGKVTESQALTWGLETAHGLQAAYQNGLLHRDVKPGNILLAKDRSAKLVDFGLALMFQREKDESEEIWATPYYVPPEKLMGRGEDHRSDIYSLGATLFHLLAGKPPIEVVTGTYEELQKAKTKPTSLKPMAPHVSPETCRLVERMMSPDPDRRPNAYDDLINMIEDAHPTKKSRARMTRARGTQVGSAGQRFLAKQRARQGAMKRKRATLASLFALVLVVGVGWAIHRAQQPRGGASSQSSSTVDPGNLGEDETPLVGSESQTALFARARQSLLDGDLEEAHSQFRTLIRSDDGPSALKQWAFFHRGLTNLLIGRESAAQEDFGQLGELQGEQRELNTIFAEAGERLSLDKKVPGNVARNTDGGSCRPVLLLAYGLKNWERGAFQDARLHLERFIELRPGSDYEWITAYHSLAEAPLEDLQWLCGRRQIESLKNEKALEEEQQALRRFVKTARTQRARSAANKRLTSIENRLEKLTPSNEAGDVFSLAQDRRVWEDCLETLLPLATSARFAEGAAFLRTKKNAFTSDAGESHLADQIHAWLKADAFLDHLVATAPGLTGNLKRLQGETLNGTITGADRTTISIRTSVGTISVPLAQVTPDSLARLAVQKIEETRDSNLYYRRQEELVLFAFLTGLEQILNDHASTLRRENRPFRERWDRLKAFKASTPEHTRHG